MDDARVSKWQWFLIFSGFSWVFFKAYETIPSAPPTSKIFSGAGAVLLVIDHWQGITFVWPIKIE